MGETTTSASSVDSHRVPAGMDDELAAAIVDRYRQLIPYREIEAELSVHRPVVSRVVRARIPEAERRQIVTAIQRRAQAEREDIAAMRGRLLRDLEPCGCPGCRDHSCVVERGHCHFCGGAVKLAEATYEPRRMVAGYPLMFCSQECVGRAGRGRLREASERVLREHGVGACGCIGHPSDCGTPRGCCHRCGQPTALAKHTDPTIPRVMGYALPYCSKKCERLGNPDVVAKLARFSGAVTWDRARMEAFYAKRWFKRLAAANGIDHTLERMARVQARAADRVSKLKRRRPNAGAPRKDALKAEWRRMFYELRQQLEGWSDFQVCMSVADAHFRAHPDVWKRYTATADGGLRPEDERKAAQRIWAAIS
jgi:hypothetical protein